MRSPTVLTAAQVVHAADTRAHTVRAHDVAAVRGVRDRGWGRGGARSVTASVGCSNTTAAKKLHHKHCPLSHTHSSLVRNGDRQKRLMTVPDWQRFPRSQWSGVVPQKPDKAEGGERGERGWETYW